MDRIQGTDGIRRDVLPQADTRLAGLSPWEAFVEAGVITDAFLEGYAFAFAREFLEPGAEVVVGRDPRRGSYPYTLAVIRGLGQAGMTPLEAGIVPTPAVPLYVTHSGAAAGLMITASHNPYPQNGVKIFFPPGLKLLPEDDRRLTRAVAALDWAALAASSSPRQQRDIGMAARTQFSKFMTDAANAWLARDSKPLAAFDIVFDPAHGSYAPIGDRILMRFGAKFGANLTYANFDAGAGYVNQYSGVADLEGVAAIALADAATGGRWERYDALAALARLGQTYRSAYERGENVLVGLVFDADGDRFYLIAFDPFADELVVLSGDEVALLQAEYLARTRGRAVADFAFMNTVESDLAVGGAAAALGFRPLLKPVGDKWILTEAWRLAAGIPGADEDAASLSAEIRDRMARGGLPAAADIPFALGCEETGHAITFGDLTTAEGRVVPFAAGNGLKAALNTLAALADLRTRLTPAELFAHLRNPFPRGYKKTNYVYFTHKELLLAGGRAYNEMKRLIPAALARQVPALDLQPLTFPEEPDLLYWAAFKAGRQELGVFCRNSGTEDKSALYVRAAQSCARAAAAIEEELYPAFYSIMKNKEHASARAERAWLEGGAKPEDAFLVQIIENAEGLMARGALTSRGRAVLVALRAKE